MKVLFWIVVTLIFEVNSGDYSSNGSTDISTSSKRPLEKENSYTVHIHKKFDKSTKIILKFDADASVKLSDKSFARIRHEESNNTFIISFYKAHEDIVLEVQALTPGVVPYFKSIVINSVEYCKDASVPADNSTNICHKLQAPRYLGAAGSELRVDLTKEHPEVIHPPSTGCGPQATCENGQCIPKSTVCDGKFDCSDGSDEQSCSEYGKCEPKQFLCSNLRCVLKTWLCDSEDDCGDGSDEQNCVEFTSDQCRSTEFACASNDQCVPKSFHCDGQGDCLDRSDEIGCTPAHVTTPPSPSNVKLNPGDTLTLVCKAVGVPVPLISWRLNEGYVPENCKDTSINGVGTLTCYNMQMEHSGAYSCEAINKKGTVFADHDAIVYVNGSGEAFPGGYFNSEARSPSESIRCFCFGKSTQCQSADLFIFNMPPLGEGGTRLVGVNQSPNGDVQIDKQPVQQYYYQPLRNGASVTKLAKFTAWPRSSALPYLTLPKTYKGNQLTSYGGHIKYRLSPQISQKSKSNENIADIIIKGTYQTLIYKSPEDRYHETYVNARLTPGDWQKPTPKGLVLASREDIMMALYEIETILLRADFNNAGVNITEFNMESAQSNNVGLGSANLVEECSCPEGYKGRSCENCADGFKRQNSGPWNGTCTMVRTATVTGSPRLKQRLTVSSASPTVNEGQNIRVVCTGTDNIPAGSIDWVRQDGTQFLSNVRSENGVLYIEYAVPENQGVYMCQAPPKYYVKPEIILLTVISIPSLEETTNITLSTDEITIPIGGSGTIDCNPRGYPLPLIKWTKYQQSFGPGTSQRENTLVINNAQDSDAGYYLCKGTVNGRTVVSEFLYVGIKRREVPRVEIYPQGEMLVRLGTQYELHCIVEGGIPQPSITWHRNGGKYFSEHVQTLQNALSFQTVEVNDEGEYTCTATNDIGSDSASAIIKVGSPPVITILPNEYIQVIPGERVKVICHAEGYPEPEVSIKSSTDPYLRVPPSLRFATLTIASASDDGDYTCTATSAAGTTEEQFIIRIDRDYDAFPNRIDEDPYDPNPTEHPSSMFAIEGQQIRITCNASKEFRVLWNRGPDQDLQINAVQNGYELVIYNTSKNDSGLYGCTLVNLQTNEIKKSTQTILQVLALPRITLRPPTQTIYSGQSPTVECIAEGEDIISVTWKPTSIAFSSRVENRGSTLIFHEIEVEDAGKYECIAMNTFGSTSAIAEVIVNGPEAPRVQIYPQKENWVTLGTQYELHCIVKVGMPQPAITWYRNDDRNFSEHVQILHNNTLSFQTVEVNDEGEYTCTATNDVGSDNASAIIKVGSLPVITISPNKYIRVIRGDRVEVICHADGYPEPEVSIEAKTGRYLWVPPSLRFATLTIGSVSDGGNYTCTATSAAGTTEEQFVIRVEEGDDAFPVTSAGLIRGCLYGGVALLWRKGLFPNATMLNCGDNIQGYLDALISGYEERAEAYRKMTSSHCGRRKITHTELIVNGSPSKAGDWPWHAALYRLDRSHIKYICGGTLISKYFVLTAAHCTSIRGEVLLSETLSVILGKFNLVGGDTGTQEKEVHQIIIHNKFEYRHLNNDIALLKLKTEVVYTDYVQPACLWHPKVHEKLPTNEIFGAVVGWGFDITDNLSHQLRQAKMPIVSDSICIKSNPLFYSHILNDNKFCAGYKNGTSACNGDSGGAFTVFVPDEAKDNSSKATGAWYIKGIVSVTVARTDAPICDPEQYIVFTDVAKYLHWIENNTK